ncbi:hypothetical protein [Geothrix sp. 21YS21S-2]|uniref:hypothetical protein n=1 Tax=Geothrix sp. 21YS21S-2 TaxID=3068893 RepID=UPI0027B89262|nr:hypothetical protein [Geothrix sp. 21YS21S-2]
MENYKEFLAVVGVISAALIAGGFSYISMIISKENEISKFRQAWIDAIRIDVSDFFGLVNALYRFTDHGNHVIHTVNHVEIKPETHMDALSKMNALANRIILRLNPTEHSGLVSMIKEIQADTNGKARFADSVLRIAQFESVIDAFAYMLKKEWNIVRDGENVFKKSKKIAYLILVTAFSVFNITIIIYFGSFVFKLVIPLLKSIFA